MSANIKWAIVRSDGDLGVSTPSSFISAMTKAFGASPWTLCHRDLVLLHGMSVTCSDDNDPYKKLADIIDDGLDTVIRVWPEY